jgi:endo-1,4-beta-xylanase
MERVGAVLHSAFPPGRPQPPGSRFGRLVAAAGLVLAGAACSEGAGGPVEPPPPPPPTTPAPATLAEAAEGRDFWIGAAVGSNFFANDTTYRRVLGQEFNVIVAENEMKFGYLQPSRGTFNFTRADQLVSFAEQHDQRVRGHTLAWHSQNPGWVNNASWSREEAIEVLRTHIQTVVGRYRGKIYAWDVANEVIGDDAQRRPGSQSAWQRMIGDDFLEIAFRAAHEADPQALLFYNDYSLEWPGAKQTATFEMLRDLKQRGVPIHGIGFQGHFISTEHGTPTETTLRETFDRFAGLGLIIELTEVDIRIPTPVDNTKLDLQAQQYRRVMKACMDHSACNTVLVWGVHDGNSWVDGHFPGFTAPLLFDRQFQKKPAYFSVYQVLRFGN